MVSSSATTVEEYIAVLPEEQRGAIQAVRDVIVANLPSGFKEVMQYGMISYVIPLERFPKTYNKKPLTLASLGAQKNYSALYLMSVYGNKKIEQWFKQKYRISGKKLDMGKSCVRFKTLADLPLALIGETISKMSPEEFIAAYEKTRIKNRKK